MTGWKREHDAALADARRQAKWLAEAKSEAFELAADLRGALAEIERLRAALEQIAVCCTDNMDRGCDHRMALDFVRQVANNAYEQKAGD